MAGICTTFAFIPQIVKVLKTKSTTDFSAGWLALTFTGLSLWLIYGLTIQSEPIVIFNFLTILFLLVIIFYKVTDKTLPINH